MYLVYSESKTGRIARHYITNTLTVARQRIKTVELKYPDRTVGYKQLRASNHG